MQTEVFRFGVIRNPKVQPKENLELSTIYVEYFDGKSAFLDLVKRYRDEHDNLDDFRENLGINFQGMDGADFIKQSFLWERGDFKIRDEELLLLTEKLSNAVDVKDIDLDGIADSSISIQESMRTKLENTIVYLFIYPGIRPEWLKFLLELLRTINFVEKLREDNSIGNNPKKLKSLMEASLVLPAEIFPLPDNSKEREKANEEGQRNFEEEVRKINEELEERASKIQAYDAAIEELSEAHDGFLNNVKTGKVETPTSFWNLPRLFIQNTASISDSTKTVMQEVNVDAEDENIDVPTTIRSIELKRGKISLKDSLGRYERYKPGISVKPGPCDTAIAVVEKVLDFPKNSKGYIEFVQIMDLLKVRQELIGHKPGELAHVENIMKGESKSKEHRKLNRVEETIFEESERSESTEDYLQSTDRYELQREATDTLHADSSREEGFSMSVDYGKVNIEANRNHSSNKSREESRRSASNYAKEVVNRSVQKIKERILTRRSTTRINEVEIINRHSFDNSGETASGHITGRYHWLNKYYRTQLINYGKRKVLSFVVPEPSAFYKFAMAKKQITDDLKPPELPALCVSGKTRELRPENISENNYMYWVGKYNVQDIQAPPPAIQVVSKAISKALEREGKSEHPGVFKDKVEPVNIPRGYYATSAKYDINGGISHSLSTGTEDSMHLSVSIGTKTTRNGKPTYTFTLWMQELGDATFKNNDQHQLDIKYAFEKRSSTKSIFRNVSTNKEGRINGKPQGEVQLNNLTGVVPVSIAGFTTLPIVLSLHLEILCKRTKEAYTRWQLDTFNSIIEAYRGLQLEYEDQKAQREFTTEVNIQGQNPQINRRIESTELKKHVISIMSGQHFESFDAMEEDHTAEGIHRYPQLNLEQTRSEGKVVRFFEQSFEWHNMVYKFYDYFWGRKEKWIEALNLNDRDPLFLKFLQAGYAKVEVPVRRGFESHVAEVLLNGMELNEGTGDVTSFVDPKKMGAYLNAIEEIKDDLGHEYDEQPTGTVSVEVGSKRVTGKDTKFTTALEDREVIIEMKSFRIRSVDEAAQVLEIDRPYYLDDGDDPSADLEEIGFWLGPKFVGEPWLVEVPTSLVIIK